jgi:predicted ester cyclase
MSRPKGNEFYKKEKGSGANQQEAALQPGAIFSMIQQPTAERPSANKRWLDVEKGDSLMNTKQMEQIVREVLEAAIHGDLHLMAQHPGLAEVMPVFEASNKAFSDRTVRFPLQFSDGVEWVATRMVESGRHTGEIMGAPPTGNTFELEVLLFHRFEDGLIVSQHSQADGSALLRALGLSVSPGDS